MDENIITVKNLQKSFGKNKVLENISFEVKRSEKVVIIGPSGGGKSTLLRCINKLESNFEGEIWFDGINVKNANSKQTRAIRQKVGMVFQQFNLFPNKTVLENIMFAPIKLQVMSPDNAKVYASNLLNTVGLTEKENAYPQSLSGGQQQRVAIARSLAMKPKVLLFDEPTSALDPEMVGDVLNVMEQLADQGMTMIIVTHEMSFAKKIADKILFMDDGEIQDAGSSEHIFGATKDLRTREFLSKVMA